MATRAEDLFNEKVQVLEKEIDAILNECDNEITDFSVELVDVPQPVRKELMRRYEEAGWEATWKTDDTFQLRAKFLLEKP